MFFVVHVKVLFRRKYCSHFPFHGVLPAMWRRGGGFGVNCVSVCVCAVVLEDIWCSWVLL